jgi:RNA:NAD 2'-phosphotransferase (TPT1/KptA family)
MNNNIINKLLYVLRHGAVKERIPIKIDGWVEINDLVAHRIFKRSNISKTDILSLKYGKNSSIFNISENNLLIRATFGHTMPREIVDSTEIVSSIKIQKLSKRLICVLRHCPLSFNIEPDNYAGEGYFLISKLLQLKQFKRYEYNDIVQCVNSDLNKRFEQSPCNLYLRATYGHTSVMINIYKIFEEIHKPFDKLIVYQMKQHEDFTKITNNGIIIGANKRLKPDQTQRTMAYFTQNCKFNPNISYIYLDMAKAMNANIKFWQAPNGFIATSGNNGVIDKEYFVAQVPLVL